MPAPPIMSDATAPLVEMFSSIQGEGMLVGARQVFLRFHGCNLACDYCDTNLPLLPSHCLMEQTPGQGDFERIPNPVSLSKVKALLEEWRLKHPNLHHSLSLTGGEPLLGVDLLVQWLPELRNLFPIYLETNGVLAAELEAVIDHLQVISMDMKLPSTSGCSDLWDQHRSFLNIAARKDTFVKVIVNNDTDEGEIKTAADIIAGISAEIPLIIQPLTTKEGMMGASPQKLLKLQEQASRILAQVRVIPQTHKFMQLL